MLDIVVDIMNHIIHILYTNNFLQRFYLFPLLMESIFFHFITSLRTSSLVKDKITLK